MRPHCLLPFFVVASLGLSAARPAQSQDPKQIYAQIKQPSTIRWCLPQAGDDPSNTISTECAHYNECLGALDLQADVDRPPFTGLSDMQIGWVRRCHQALADAARAHPQIKGAAATVDWLEHRVYPATEAKPSTASWAPPSPR